MILHPVVIAAVESMSDQNYEQIAGLLIIARQVEALEHRIDPLDDKLVISSSIDERIADIFKRCGVSEYALDDFCSEEFLAAIERIRTKSKERNVA